MADIESRADVSFEHLTKRLSSLVYAKLAHDKIVLNKILDDLNGLNYEIPFIEINERAVLVINQCCYLIPVSEVILVKKALSLFQSLLTKQNITVEGKTLSLAIIWCLDCLKCEDSTVYVPALLALQSLTRGNCLLIDELTDKLISIYINLAKQRCKDDPPVISHNALKCIEALTCSKENEEHPETLTKVLLQTLFNILYDDAWIQNDLWQCKFYITALSGLKNLVDNWSEAVSETLPDIIGVIKGYMLFGLPGQDNYKIEKVLPTNVALPEQLKPPATVKKVKGKYDKKSRKKNISSISAIEQGDEEEELNSKNDGYVGYFEINTFQNMGTTSDSDFSDGEIGLKGKTRSLQTNVRHCALILLGTLLQKGNVKVLVRFLTSLLPDGSHVPHRTLITCLLKESSAKCRSEVLIALSLILSKFKPFLAMADNVSRSSFTTISSNIGCILQELHRSLILALVSENSSTVTTHILKTISDLIRCTPYHKLDKGILMKIVKHVKTFISHKDVNVKISALTVFGCAASVNPQLPESRRLIYGAFSDENESEFGGKPWLFNTCVGLLMKETESNLVVSVECLQVLGALVHNFFYDIVVCYPNDIFEILNFGSSKKDYSIRLYTSKLMETMSVSLHTSLTCEDESKRTPLGLAAKIWDTIIPGPITVFIQSEDKSSLRSRGCACIGNIGVFSPELENSVIFDEISRANQIVCITHLFGCTKDEAPPVRGTAIRSLAVFILFPSLRQDFLFFLDTIDAFFAAAADESQNVRAQASWLYGNITEAAIANAEEEIDESIDEATLVRLLEAGIKLAKDNPKVKPNAVRGIGNILKLPTNEFAQKEKELVVTAVENLLKNASSGSYMKARWNSCYALANALSNPCISALVKNKVFPVLIDLVQNYRNFKVRISAGFALAALKSRNDYGEHFLPTWTALECALVNAENITDFSEYQHRDQLVDQICLTMCHLISLLSISDLVPLQDLLITSFGFDPLQRHLQRFKDRIIPEKSNSIINADAKLAELLDEKSLNREQKNALTVLCGLFLTDKQN